MLFRICFSLIAIYTLSVNASKSEDTQCCDKPHEHFSDCGTCETTCRNFNVSFGCAAVCMVGCFCDEGFVRNHEGDCVRIKHCFECNGENEFFDCGSACDRECATLGQQCPIVNIKCNDKCYCKPGFARDNRNICVPIKQCPASPHKSCGINELLDCLCLPRSTCKAPSQQPMYCPLDSCGKCIKECICKPGFMRNENGQCVHCSQCAPLDKDDCCEDEEFQTCGTFCPESCTDKQGQALPCTKQCVQGCFCKKSHVRDENGCCVRREDCGMPLCQGNETWVECARTCPPDSCESMWTRYNCQLPQPPVDCKPACKCADGYLRNKVTHQCILTEECLLH